VRGEYRAKHEIGVQPWKGDPPNAASLQNDPAFFDDPELMRPDRVPVLNLPG
jgi:hypothetical protein